MELTQFGGLQKTRRVIGFDSDKNMLTLFRMGGGKKAPYQFFPCSFFKRRNQPRNFMTFNINTFAFNFCHRNATNVTNFGHMTASTI